MGAFLYLKTMVQLRDMMPYFLDDFNLSVSLFQAINFFQYSAVTDLHTRLLIYFCMG